MLPFAAPIDFKQDPTEPVVRLPDAPQAQSKLGQIMAGIYQGAIKPTVEFAESPVGFATIGLGAVPKLVQKGVAGLFAPVAFRNMEEARQRANEVAADPNASLQDRVIPIADAVSQGLMGIGAARHAIPKPNLGRLDITAWHGTPHEVDRFSMDKIGTGEGAQSYGHGLYFAESPAVAGEYQKNLAKDMFGTRDGRVFDPQRELQHVNVRATAYKSGADLEPTIARARELLVSQADNAYTRPLLESDLAKLIALQQQGGLQPLEGNLYKVDLAPNHEDFLHWDKPLSEQSPQVQAALAKLPPEAWGGINEELDSRMMATLGDTPWAESDFSGRDLYQSLIRNREGLPAHPAEYDREVAPPELVSHILNQAGIPGIAYLDQGSRASGQGTHNYVMFDDKGIKILEKNGQPVAPPQGDLASVVSGLDAKFAELEARAKAGDQAALAEAQAMTDARAQGAGAISDLFHHGEFDPNFHRIPNTEQGFHMGTEEAARQRAYDKQPDDERASLQIEQDPETGNWHWTTRSHSSDMWNEEGFPSQAHAERNAHDTIAEMHMNNDSDLEDLGVMSKLHFKPDNLRQVEDQGSNWYDAIQKAKTEGVGSFGYKNEFEDKGSQSYVAFRPEQVKLADAFTYDDAGKLIPLSKRFDWTNPDIRYMAPTALGLGALGLGALQQGNGQQ